MKDSCVACRLYQLTYWEGVALQDMHLLTFNHVLLDSNLSNLEQQRYHASRRAATEPQGHVNHSSSN